MDRLDYLGYLARAVPPHRLAAAAARRLWRGALRWMSVPSAASEEEILRSFQAPSVVALPRRLAAPVQGRWGFASPPGVASAARTLERRLPHEAERALEAAEAALAGRCRIFGREVALVRSERPVPHASPGWRAIDWEADPSGDGADVKFRWAMGRLDGAVHLACGAALCGDEAFAHAALDLCLDFLAAPMGVQWSCAMEVALRAANVAIALRLLAGHPALQARPAALLEILRGLTLHLRWVEAHLEDENVVPNNHLVSDLAGLAVVGALLPRLPGAAWLARRALRRLEGELFAQTLPDGFCFEGSVGYHRLAVELWTLAELAADGLAAPFSPAARDRIREAFRASAALIDGRGMAPQIGDEDSGRAWPFRSREAQEMAHVLPVGAALFAAPELRRGEPSAELIWLLGAPGLARFEALPRARPAGDTALRSAGIFVLRSPRISCAVACGPNGTGGTGTHGHNDKLGIEVCVDGRLVIADPGTGSYTGDPALRNRLRGTAAHSTVLVEGLEQQPLPEGRLFALPDTARARLLRFGDGTFAGEHRGYERLPQQVVHRREIRLGELLVVRDELRGTGVVFAQARFLVPCDARIRAATPKERMRLPADVPWDCERAVEIRDAGRPLALLVGAGAAGTPLLEEGIYAEGYGRTKHALHVCFPMAGGLPSVFNAALLPLGAATGCDEEAGYGAA